MAVNKVEGELVKELAKAVDARLREMIERNPDMTDAEIIAAKRTVRDNRVILLGVK